MEKPLPELAPEYKRFDYGKYNFRRSPMEDMDEKYLDPEYRISIYNKAIKEIAQLLYDECKGFLKITQEEKKAVEILEYILRLLPPQDFLDFYLHVPRMSSIEFIGVVRRYDQECFLEALDKLHEPNLKLHNFNQVQNSLRFY